MSDKLHTRTQRALKLDEVPEERFAVMFRRTITGTLFLALGVFLLYFMWHAFKETKEASLTLLIGGVASMTLGAHIFSGQILSASIVSLREPLTVVREFWKGKGDV